ncbi:MAG: rod shape-determining protein MreD [Deltaproteobacteria bacterium]|jgi:rod shape-determining protein MreD|nr:rod shape-determining protein MreD [Deltaproteobacteria bacterium]
MALARYSLAAPAPLARLWPLLVLGPVLTAVTGFPRAGLYLNGWRPDWAFLLTLFLALRTESWLAYLGAFVLGFFQGYLSLAPPGLFCLKLALGVLITRGLARKLELKGFLPLSLLALCLGGALGLGLEPWLLGLTQSQPSYQFLNEPTLIIAARTVFVSALGVAPFFRLLDRLFHPKESP